MKNYKQLYKDIKEFYKEELGEDFEDLDVFIKVEIMMYLLEVLGFSEKDISKGWTILNGFHLNIEFNINISESQWEMIDKARGFLPELKGSTSYKNFLSIYLEFGEINKLLYRLKANSDNEIVLYKNNSKSLKGRNEKIKGLYNNIITFQKNSKSLYDEEQGYIEVDGLIEAVNFPQNALSCLENNKKIIDIKKSKEIIKFNKKDLLNTADFIDSIVKGKRYKERVSNISFDIIENKQINRKDYITIDGLFNMVGRVGAGKSTLIQVLTTKLALENKKVGLIVDSVKSIFELVEFFTQLNINAVPIMGYSGRHDQIDKVYSNIIEEDFQDIKKSKYNKWLSQTCILDGLRRSSDIIKPFESGKEPCLFIKKNIKNNKNFACPYYNICPSHISDRELDSATVYITTPAAFIKSRISPVVINEDVKVSEYLYYKCDLIVFDESDRVLQSFEQQFTDNLVLLDEGEDAYLDKLGEEVSKWFYSRRLRHVSNKKVSKWYSDFTNTQRIANVLIEVLNENNYLIKELSGGFYTAFSLHGKFRDKDSKKSNNINWENTKYDILNEYILNTKNELDQEGSNIIKEMLSGNFTHKNLTYKIKQWYFKKDYVSENNMMMLKFIFILTILEKCFKSMINGIDEIPEIKKLNIDKADLIYRTIKDYVSIVPSSPVGNKFGIRVIADSNNNLKRLTIFKSSGLGRWFLTNYHKLFYSIDKLKGPNVILLSGTSWAPKSYSYHIEAPVNCILNGLDEEAKAIEKSEFFFKPTFHNKAINVSGTDLNQRIEKLKIIIDDLIRPRIRGKGHFAKEIDILDQGRKRILLLVGSYREAESVKNYLDSILTNEGDIKKNEVCLLTRDGEGKKTNEDISRGEVGEFGLTKYKILIAPLMALERGYNILNENNQAAIGSVYFLVRPMPIPSDMSVIVNKVNSSFMKKLNKKNSSDIFQHVNWVKEKRDEHLTLMQNLLVKSERLGYKELEQEDREALCMTLFVTMCQVIGRLIRGGCKARVYFCDAKFAPESVENKVDTSKTSILVGIIETLEKLINNEDDIVRELSRKLYYPFLKGLKECEGLKYDKKRK